MGIWGCLLVWPLVCFLCMPCRGGADLGWKGVFEGCVLSFFFNTRKQVVFIHGALHGAIHGAMHGAIHGVLHGAIHGPIHGVTQVAPGISILNSTSFRPCYFFQSTPQTCTKRIPESLLCNLHEARSEDDSRLIRLPVL